MSGIGGAGGGDKTYVYCLHVSLGVSSGGWVNKVPGSLQGDMGRLF